jgi:lipopolysaccharide transport system ATP-binding protein
MSEEALISLSNVACRYKVRHGLLGSRIYEALRDVSFTIYKGETLALIGKNGAGKSTLLRMLAGIILPDAGRVEFYQPVSVSLLTLQLGFSPELSGRDNAIMGAMFLGYSRRDAMERLGQVIDFSELHEWIDEPLKTYSSGMRARLGFAVAMEMSPDVLLVDEVLGVGDEAFRKKSAKAMRDKMKSGRTVVFVSHQANTVLELCSRAVWIEQGATRMVDRADRVVRAYQQERNPPPAPARERAAG